MYLYETFLRRFWLSTLTCHHTYNGQITRYHGIPCTWRVFALNVAKTEPWVVSCLCQHSVRLKFGKDISVWEAPLKSMKSIAVTIIITLNNHRIITLFAARLLMARLRHTLSACPHLYHFPITNIKQDFYQNLKENKDNTPVSATATILKPIRDNLHNPGS